ncbi:MAG: hypothetical protein ABIH89_08765 [Elusimicrobiota bacterium]
MSTFQISETIETVAAIQFDMIECTVSFFKTKILFPYLTIFTESEEFFREVKISSEEEKSNTKSVPVRKKAGRGLFGHLYYVLSAVLMTNRELFFLLMVAVFTFGTTLIRKKAYDRDCYMPGRIRAGIMYYTSWILKFLTPWDRYLKSRVNEFDIARVKGFRGKGTRILNEVFGMRVFFMSIEESKLYTKAV